MMLNKSRFDENIFWDFVDGNLTEKDKNTLLKACEGDKELAHKLESTKITHDKLKVLVPKTLECTHQMTDEIMAVINKQEVNGEEINSQMDSIVIGVFLILISCLGIPLYYVFEQIELFSVFPLLFSNDSFIYITPITIIGIISIYISHKMQFSNLKRSFS